MAPLPDRRLGVKLKPFNNVGLDFAGPFDIKMGRGKIRKKVYVLVLTCMVTRGVHLETTAAWTLHMSSTLSHGLLTSEGCPRLSHQTIKLHFEKQIRRSQSGTRQSTGTPFRRLQDSDSGQTLTASNGTSIRQMLLTSAASSKLSSRHSNRR
jgi:hypothetical protein